ncbi:MAG TPA: Rid family hydrolase [Xanthobacteraceae bacterium]|jgi:enamine deaminase RidA (YjgF/YER057c/UK114 family)
MTKNFTCSVEPLLPVELGSGKIKFAQGVKAGRWVFATGLMAQDFATGIAPDVLAERVPHAGLPKREKEAQRIFEHLDAVLRTAGTDRGNLVRTDQYYTTVKAVPPYQQIRRQFLQGRIPPSTSIAQQRLLLPGADMNIQAMATISEKGFEVEHLKHEQLRGRPTSGYSPAVTVGDFIFLPGITSLAVGDEPRRNGVATAALMAEGVQWGGQPIKLETEFIITKRIAASLALAGAKLDDVVHAQVYLTDRDDYSAFNETWTRHFGENGPTVSVIPCIEHGLAPYDGKIEINIIAAKPGSSARKRRVNAGIDTSFRRQPQAVQAGDLLFIPALMAANHHGLVPSAAVDPRQPHFSSSPEAQAEVIIDYIARLCHAAETALANVVRLLLFLTDINEFYAVYKVWERRLGGHPISFSAVEVPGPLPVPGATVMMETWVYAPN